MNTLRNAWLVGWLVQLFLLRVAGQYECRIQQVNSQELGPLISTLDTYVQLQAIVQPQEHQPEVPSGVISLPFLPAFHVHTSEVHVSNLLPLTSVRVSAVDKVIQDLKVSSDGDASFGR